MGRLRLARQDVEAELRRSERLLGEAEALGKVGTWEFDAERNELYSSAENCRLFFGPGSSKGSRLEDYFEAVHPDDRAELGRQNDELLAGRGSPHAEFRVVWPDGSVHWIFGHKQVMRNARGEWVRQIGTNADITERKHAEEELRRRVRQLEAAEAELRGQREQLAALSRRLIEAQEAERRAVARELHDDFGQVLTALRLHLQKNGGTHEESIELVDQAIGRMHDLALDLRPAILDDLGLAAALRWYVAREAQRAGLEVRLDVAELSQRLPPAIETTCFRLVQEALTNVARHAQARSVTVALAEAPGEVRLSVCDDGRGFEMADARKRANAGQSQGLVGMRERVQLAGGELQIDASCGRGTSVRARFPRGDEP